MLVILYVIYDISPDYSHDDKFTVNLIIEIKQ